MHGSQGTTHGVQTAESIVKEWEEEERENAARLALSDLQTIFRDRSPALTIRAVEKEIQRRMQTRKVAFKDFRRRFNANAGVLEEERCEKLRRIFRVLAQLRRLLDLLQMREEEGDVHEEAHMNSSGTHRNNNNNNGLVAISKSKEWLSVARENQREIEEERTTANRSLEHITADRGAVGGAVFRAGKAHHPRSRGAQLTAMATDQQEQQRNKKKKEMATTIVMKRKTHEKDDDDGDVVPHRASLHNPQASSAKAPRLNFKEMMPNDDASKAPQGLCSYCCESYPFNDLARVEVRHVLSRVLYYVFSARAFNSPSASCTNAGVLARCLLPSSFDRPASSLLRPCWLECLLSHLICIILRIFFAGIFFVGASDALL